MNFQSGVVCFCDNLISIFLLFCAVRAWCEVFQVKIVGSCTASEAKCVFQKVCSRLMTFQCQSAVIVDIGNCDRREIYDFCIFRDNSINGSFVKSNVCILHRVFGWIRGDHNGKFSGSIDFIHQFFQIFFEGIQSCLAFAVVFGTN